MDQLRERYSFDEKDCLGGLFEDAGIRNASYRAIRNRDGKEVQIVVYKSAKPGQISSYWKKINKFAEVQHFNLTPILECTQDAEENMLFIVLEWTQGYSLKEFLGDGVLNWRAAYFIIKDVLSGLSELHKAGLVYSFINLENIEIFEGRGRLSFRYLIYKTYYLSPEVKENHQKSRESDLFSIGVCLFRLIFGALPFKAKSPAEFVKSVKAGVAKRLPIENTFFPKIVPTQMQEYINVLCNYVPAERLKYEQLQKKVEKIMKLAKPIDKQLIASILGASYVLLSVEECSQQYIRASVISIAKRKQKQQKRIFHLEMIRHNLTQISTYIDDIIVPFKNATNLYLANIQEFYVIQKDCLVIVYDYCSQASLMDYHELTTFSKEMVEQVSSVLRNLLSQWKGQYRFLTNHQILLNNGRPVLKHPPFPTSDLKAKLKLSKKGNYFIAPQVEAGIQSINADSWSVGAIEYWMRYNVLPEFDEGGALLIKDRSQLSPQKALELTELVCKKHRERRNLFPLENKPLDRKISSDSYSSSESPRMSSRIKSIPSAPHALRMTSVGESDEVKELVEEQIDEFELITPTYDNNSKQEAVTRKKVQSGDHGKTNKNAPQSQLEEGAAGKDLKLQGLAVIKNRRSHQKIDGKVEAIDENIFMDQQSMNNKDDGGMDISTSQLNFIEKPEEPLLSSKLVIKRFPTFSGVKDEKVTNHRDSIQKERDRESTKYKKESAAQSKNPRRKTFQSSLGVEEADMSSKLLSGLAKEGWKLSLVEKHWSKPIRVILKGIIALLIYIFAFYYNFLAINGSLMKSRYDFSTELLTLRSDSLSSTPTINFTSVTRSPLETYDSLNNQTLSYVRDVVKCVTNDYNNHSDVAQILSSGSFGTYQAFGFIFVIVNILVLCLYLAKLDLPKALSMTQFDDHFYVPLYSWLLVNLALASLTSCTYLTYGGLFNLQLDPCLSRSTFPSLTYLLKGENSKFILNFLWVYLGMLVAYILIFYLIIRPKAKMHKYLYLCLVLLYLGGVGVRALGTYSGSISSIFGACGELLSFLVAIPLFLIDLLVSCKLRKLQKPSKGEAGKGKSEIEFQATEDNFNE